MPEVKILNLKDNPDAVTAVHPYLAWTCSGRKAPCLGLNVFVGGFDNPVRIRTEDLAWLIRSYLKQYPVVITKKPWKSAHYFYVSREATEADMITQENTAGNNYEI